MHTEGLLHQSCKVLSAFLTHWLKRVWARSACCRRVYSTMGNPNTKFANISNIWQCKNSWIWTGKYLAARYSEVLHAKTALGKFQLSQECSGNFWWIICTSRCFLEALFCCPFIVLCEENRRRNSYVVTEQGLCSPHCQTGSDINSSLADVTLVSLTCNGIRSLYTSTTQTINMTHFIRTVRLTSLHRITQGSRNHHGWALQ